METDKLNQEILLNVNSSFCKKEWCEKELSNEQQKLSQKEQLKKMCWDGLLAEWLPEICNKVNNKPITLWEVLETSQSLHLRLGDYNSVTESVHSLNPFKMLDEFSSN